jgi:peptide/nickel transport system ATP-binding protein
LTAANGISLDINLGEVVGLVGESGCGKSTIAKIIMGLEKATSGNVFFAGAPIENMDREEMSRRIQPIFQDPYSSLNPRKSIEAIVSLPYRVHKVGNKAQMEARVEEILEIVGLPSRMRYVSVQSQILNLLLDLRDKQGLTYMIITHNLCVVEHIATRVAVMYLGRIVEEAETKTETKTLFANPRHPYTNALLASVLTPEPQLGLPETHLGIAYPNPIDPPSGCTFHPRCPKAVEADHLVACHHPE